MGALMVYQFSSERGFTDYFTNEQFCIEYFMKLRWPNGVECVECQSKNICTFENDRTRFKCRDCKKIFSYLVGTIFQNTKKPLSVWFRAIFKFSLDNTVTSYELAKYCNVVQPTAWLMLNKIRFAISSHDHGFLFGQTMSDQLGVSENGELITLADNTKAKIQIDEAAASGENRFRHLEDKIEGCGGRSPYGTKIMGMYDKKTKRVKLVVIPNTTKKTLLAAIDKYILPGTVIITDDFSSYDQLRKIKDEQGKEKYEHYVVNHSNKQFTIGNHHTQNIESIWRKVKAALSKHIFVSPKYVQLYLNEQEYKINNVGTDLYPIFCKAVNLGFTGYISRRQLINRIAA
jgi:transposase-like protein